ncbi:hypothetical protein SAMN04489798_3832 [Pseudomonas arsenicoxydans]|uniref:Uncharacterized protein n=1 Tax=Pseudomonas arsenicoxydans TaxID=702115 RepID=A0A1H0MCN6_9PSED|nr:hypothetical protein SAMN04489798_3832 [Pseudomonas arsenicoxydans]
MLGRRDGADYPLGADLYPFTAMEVFMIVPTLCVGMPQSTLCVRSWDAERPGLHSHAERGNDQQGLGGPEVSVGV